jgi:hypothetical protein
MPPAAGVYRIYAGYALTEAIPATGKLGILGAAAAAS